MGNGGEASRAASNDPWVGKAARSVLAAPTIMSLVMWAPTRIQATAFIMKNVSSLVYPFEPARHPTSVDLTVDMNRQAILEFSENEVYSSFGGFNALESRGVMLQERLRGR